MQLSVSPERAPLDSPVATRLTGLIAGADVTVRARMQAYAGASWVAEASFVADADGVVDVARDAPVEGSYEGIDAMGLFWSMREEAPDAPPVASRGRFTVQITAEIAGEVVALTSVERLHRADDVVATDVRDLGLVGRYFRPRGSGPHPPVLLVGGSGGGLGGSQLMAAVLAGHGFATLALAYFRMEGLPPTLTDIPLEYFESALGWLASQPDVGGDGLGAIGFSRGGELVLLLGATYLVVRTVVAYVPSHVVWRGVGDEWVPSWTMGGEPVPTMRRTRPPSTPPPPEPPPDVPFATTPGFLRSLEDRAAEAHATIPAERINGSVMLVSGREDAMWPSSLMAERVAERLAAHRHPYLVEHLDYPGAGHGIYLPNLPTTTTTQVHPVLGRLFDLGGNPRDIAHASADSWPRVVRFLDESLRPKSSTPSQHSIQ